MNSFQILTKINLFKTKRLAKALCNVLEAELQKISLNSYLITDHANKAMILISKNGLATCVIKHPEQLAPTLIKVVKDVIDTKHVTIHLDNTHYEESMKTVLHKSNLDMKIRFI